MCPVKAEMGEIVKTKDVAGSTIPDIELVAFMAAPVHKMAMGLLNLPCELSHRCG
jgi:hypothetical protein